MPGELITADGQMQVRSLLMLAEFAGPAGIKVVSWVGLRGKKSKTGDLPLLGDGTRQGVDRLAARDVAVSVLLRDPSQSGLDDKLDLFDAAWANGGDVELHWRTGGVQRYIVGRTRDYEYDERNRGVGIVEAVAEFIAGDPTIHTVP
jgi:hypothetical protein